MHEFTAVFHARATISLRSRIIFIFFCTFFLVSARLVRFRVSLLVCSSIRVLPTTTPRLWSAFSRCRSTDNILCTTSIRHIIRTAKSAFLYKRSLTATVGKTKFQSVLPFTYPAVLFAARTVCIVCILRF